MEQQIIAGLLEKYWRAETTVEEERVLAAYFRQSDIAPEWEFCRRLFAYYEEEARIVPGENLGDRILERIRELEEEQNFSGKEPGRQPGEERRPPVRSLWRINWSYAAAAVVILGFSLFLMIPVNEKKDQGTVSADSGAINQGMVKDTYEDPEQALAAIQKALLTVSVKMSRGKHITQQHMDRLNDSWNSAIAN
jgi:hypothetical protein